MHRYIESFLGHLVLLRRSGLTVSRYRDVLHELFSDDTILTEITGDTLLRLTSSPRVDGRPRAPAGINLRVAVLKAAFSYLHAEGLIPTNPSARLVGMKLPRRQPKYLTTAELHRLLAHLARRRTPNRLRDLVMVLVLWQTGLRVSELARLTWAEVDPERRRLRDVLIKGGHVLDVLLNQETLDALLALRAARLGSSHADPIFTRYDGKRLSVRAIEALFQRWRAELGWTRPLHPHVMRHSHATGELGEGVPIDVVAASLRHSGVRTVSQYAITQDRALRAGLGKLGALVPREILEEIRAIGANDNARREKDCVEEPFDAHSAASMAADDPSAAAPAAPSPRSTPAPRRSRRRSRRQWDRMGWPSWGWASCVGRAVEREFLPCTP